MLNILSHDFTLQIALGACKDPQLAWEDNGESLTAVFKKMFVYF